MSVVTVIVFESVLSCFAVGRTSVLSMFVPRMAPGVTEAMPPRRSDLAGTLHVELLLAREARNPALERRLLHARLKECIAQLLPDRLRRRGDLGHLAHVALVRLVLARLLAALDPENEQHD